MKKKSEKKLNLGKVKIATLNQTKPLSDGVITLAVCEQNISTGAKICSVDSCRF
jgi:hypothetical protein